MADRTVGQALAAAKTIMTARSTDARLTTTEKALAAGHVTLINAIIPLLRADNTLAPAQRAARASQLKARLDASNFVLEARLILPAVEWYDGINLMDDCANYIAQGIGTFWSVLGTGN